MSSDQRTEWLGSPEKQGAVWGVDHSGPHVGSEPFGTHESDGEVARERLRVLISAIEVASQGRARFAVHDHSEARCLAEIAYQRSWYEFASHLCKSFHRRDGTISDATAEKASLDRAIRIAEGLHPGFASRHVGTAMLAPEQGADQSAEPTSPTTPHEFDVNSKAVPKVAVDSGVDEESQEGGFMNATLQSAGPDVAMSIATSLAIPPEVFSQGHQSIEQYVNRELLAAASNCEGLSFHVQLGPSRDALCELQRDESGRHRG